MDKRTNRVFSHSERRDINFPMWRKKVDRSLFHEKGFTVVKFAEKWWDLSLIYPNISNSRKDKKNEILIEFEESTYLAHITLQNSKSRKGTYRVFYNQDLADALKEKFLMTFMRDLEHQIGDYDSDAENRISIEEVIPFSEFLDIEFDAENKRFILTAHYTHLPTFPNLFSKILDSTVLKSISLELEGKLESRVVKSKWYQKSELLGLPDQPNVLYMLFDKDNSEFYIGEAKKLKTRLTQDRPEIPNWTHFRYSVLPPELSPFRVQLERMVIRDFASILPSSKLGFDSIKISECQFKNKKIDN